MTYLRFLLLIGICTCLLTAQPPDVDALSRDLDLSVLEETVPTPDASAGSDIPPSHLFFDLDLLDIPALPEKLLTASAAEGIFHFSLPAATYLVVANPARLDQAYALMADTLSRQPLHPAFPLKLALHADGNFSAALRLLEIPADPLPLGVGLSPIPEMHFAGVMADIQLLRKDHPPVLEAFTRLQTASAPQGTLLDRSEFYFFPLSPGKVLFALRVKTPDVTGK